MTTPRVVPSPMKPLGSHISGENVERCTLVILGAGGDLMKRKLLPALYYLASEKLLPAEFNLVAVGRDPIDERAFVDSMRAALENSDEIKANLTLFKFLDQNGPSVEERKKLAQA